MKSHFASLSVVVVEEDAKEREILRRYLSDFGVKDIRPAVSMDHGWHLIKSRPPRLVICADKFSQGGKGFHLARLLRDAAQKSLLDALEKKATSSAPASPQKHGGPAAPQPIPMTLPIMLITEQVTQETILEARMCGISGLLLKPYNQLQLGERIVKIMQWAVSARAPASETIKI